MDMAQTPSPFSDRAWSWAFALICGLGVLVLLTMAWVLLDASVVNAPRAN